MNDLECIDCGRPSKGYLCETCSSIKEEEYSISLNKPIRNELDKEQLIRFALGGNATFTLYNTKKETHLTYKIRICDNNDKLFFVSILTGPDNWSNYTFLGIIRIGQDSLGGTKCLYTHGNRSKITRDAISAKTFEWFWNNIDRLPSALKVFHEGKCGRCGRKLTVPESISSGFGPECIKFLS
jgi:Family of unknown function (DUF6011)